MSVSFFFFFFSSRRRHTRCSRDWSSDVCSSDLLWGGLETATHRDWQWVLGVNLWGVVHGLEAFLPRMIAQKEPGHVVNTASMAGLVATRGLGIYNTSKYAVVGLSETLAKDLKSHQIGVSVLCPMGVSTRIRASERSRPAHLWNDRPSRTEPVELMGRSLEPETVAEMVLQAIFRNELYVITHDEGLEPLGLGVHREVVPGDRPEG